MVRTDEDDEEMVTPGAVSSQGVQLPAKRSREEAGLDSSEPIPEEDEEDTMVELVEEFRCYQMERLPATAPYRDTVTGDLLDTKDTEARMEKELASLKSFDVYEEISQELAADFKVTIIPCRWVLRQKPTCVKARIVL